MKQALLFLITILCFQHTYAQSAESDDLFKVNYNYFDNAKIYTTGNTTIRIFAATKKQMDTNRAKELILKSIDDITSINDQWKSEVSGKQVYVRYKQGIQSFIKTNETENQQSYVRENGQLSLLKTSRDSIIIIDKENQQEKNKMMVVIVEVDDVMKIQELKNHLNFQKLDNPVKALNLMITPNLGISVNTLTGVTPSIGFLAAIDLKQPYNRNSLLVGINLEVKQSVTEKKASGLFNYSLACINKNGQNGSTSGFLLGWQQIFLQQAPGSKVKPHNNYYLGLVAGFSSIFSFQLDIGGNFNNKEYSNYGVTINFKF